MDLNISSFTTSNGEIYGCYERSENGRYLLVWHDKPLDDKKSRKKKGSFFLFERDTEIFKGAVDQTDCEAGHVADDGTFVISECYLDSIKPSSTFYAFTPDGNLILKKKYSANPVSSALSKDGHFAIYQTANSDTSHGNLLTLFDLRARTVIWKINPIFWAYSYEFHLDANVVSLKNHERGGPYKAVILSLT